MNQPEIFYVFARIDWHLAHAVDTRRRRRDHLAHPIRRLLEVWDICKNGHAFPSPTGEVWNENIRTQMQFRLEEYPPPTGSARTTKWLIKRIEHSPDNR
jgi:hypothetical protein